MAQYVFDTGPFITLFSYYFESRFPTLWKKFDTIISNEKITSTREVFKELQEPENRLTEWSKSNRNLFPNPNIDELAFVREIFSFPNFQNMIEKRKRWKGKPVADPFVIARAKLIKNSCVVTSEVYKPNSAKIPNVCKHFGVECVDLEGFMEREGWEF